MPEVIAVLHPPQRSLIAAGQRGATGPVGPVGPASNTADTYTAGAIVGGHRVVYAVGDVIFHADASVLDQAERVVGISLQAAVLGDPCIVKRNGPLVEQVWAWTPGPVYLTGLGLLTQVPPETGVLLQVGIALDATTLDVRIGTPIVME